MGKDELKSKVKEFEEIAETLSEKYQQICFEKLISDYLQGDEKTSKNGVRRAGGGSTNEIGDFSDVMVIKEDEVNVLAELPGSTMKEKSINAALLVLMAKLTKGQTEVVTSEIRKVCEAHACLNKKNFATQLKSARSLFLLSGKKSGTKARLTEPGKKRAKQLLSEMISAAK